ncbi:hypothetical protein LTR10_019979 [Elasticomyces elasticus]|uniref:ABM domain-containing protein n=1 Tax=Exophiala sideris TaxID=1016849 RepID=A0ABR0IZ67_9EURO|nr:hypothetical protein LTR10_019979 [Elasticomyces elasticus]KAK5022444.1 hypothetical protein LTS07_010104 [Exophiala sideris]KAK5027198.1 hypothetical protein LTR13_009593 [Exophiala sideris]KAK5051298.1 hypothetical protein LTR69_010324 [Exophiala sideris]KAK5177738.1 hypothetical protein LTR44_009713 [Eurotiomycetes sp. CCFEE 6388]
MPAATLPRERGMMVIWGEVSDKTINEEGLNEWWTYEHLPERIAIPGFRRARRYYSVSENSKSQYLVCYEVSSLDIFTSPAYMDALNNPTPGTQTYMPLMASLNRLSCSRPEFNECSASGTGATLVLITFQPPISQNLRDELGAWIAETIWPSLSSHHQSLLAIHLLRYDSYASQSGSSTKSYEKVSFQSAAATGVASPERWVILVELTESITAPFAQHRALTHSIVQQLKRFASEIESQAFGLICALSE